jgi:hypothetical protein
MSKYLIPLIEKRLVELERQRSLCQSIINEDPVRKWSQCIKEFNASKNGFRKILLAKKMAEYEVRIKSWIRRSSDAHDKLLEIQLEVSDLNLQLALAKMRYAPSTLKDALKEKTNG